MDKNYFEVLNAINVNDKTEKKEGLTYLSWAWALSEVLKHYPDMTYEVKKFDGKPFIYDENTGYMVFTEVTLNGIIREMWLPVMDSKNKAMKAEPYEYTTKYGKKTVEAATMFDINKTIMRCLTKNFAMFGFSLYIYAGEDLPEEESGENPKKVDTPAEAEKEADDIKTRLINNVQVKSIEAELRRTGVKPLQITSQYKVKTLGELNFEQWKEIMTRLEVTPDKPKKDLGL